MRRALILTVLGVYTVPGIAALPDSRAPPYREGEVIVKYRGGARGSAAKQLRSDVGLIARRALLDGRAELLDLPLVITTEAAIRMLGADPEVQYAEPNYLRSFSAAIPDDPSFASQWGLRNSGLPYETAGPVGVDDAPVAGADLNLTQAWDQNGDGVPDRTGDRSVTVAIVDDGFQLDHPDLAANFAGVPRFDFADNDDDPSPNGDEHGTLVAGCIGALGNNQTGIASPIWNVRLMPLRFGLDTAQFVTAMQFARDNGAQIINASFGGPQFSQLEFDAIANLRDNDILLVTSAGNTDSNTDLAVANYPSNYNLPNVLTVAASNRGDNITGFSQYGPATVDVAAPGVEILTTAVGSTYQSVAGTSFSSPYVAGVAALIKNYHPAATFREIRARLIEGAVGGVGSLSDASARRTRGGRVDAARALDMAAQPSLLIKSYAVLDGANGKLDPGETATLAVTLENIWLDAANVTTQLNLDTSDCGTVSFDSTAQTLGAMVRDAEATANFSITPDASITGHCYLPATVRLTADGGYDRTRHFILELGRLALNAAAQESLQTSKFDEFHAWHVDVPNIPGTTGLRFRTTASSDIDLLIKHALPPLYDIQLLFLPEPGEGQLFFTDADEIGGEAHGNEDVTITNPQAGTYHLVVVNFSQAQQTYTLRANLIHPGAFSFTSSAFSASEAAGAATITVDRQAASGADGVAGAASVLYSSAEGSALSGCDYTPVSGTLNWSAGEAGPKTFTVPIGDDIFAEGDETLTLTLSNPAGAVMGATTGAVLTIQGNDAGGPADTGALSFVVSAFNVFESQPTTAVMVDRGCGSSGAASVQYATGDGTATGGPDYIAASGFLNWADGDRAPKTFTVGIVNDADDEPSETLTVTLSNASGAPLGAFPSTVITILDDDLPPPPPPSGGGGGAVGSSVLLVSLLALLRRRRLRA